MSTNNRPDPAETYVGLEYVATRYQLGHDAIMAAIRRGELPAFRVGPKFIRIRKADADGWAKPYTHQSRPGKARQAAAPVGGA